MNGYDLVALIFAREVSDPLTSLVKTIDRQLQEAAVRHHTGNRLGVFVVFCSNDPTLQQQLQKLIAKEGLKNVVFTVSANGVGGPSRYRFARDAELTVVIYENRSRVMANYVLDSEDLNTDRANDVLKSLRKVLP